MGVVLFLVGFVAMLAANGLGVAPQFGVILMLAAMAVAWLLIPLIDTLWYKYKFPEAFDGVNVWSGQWTSGKHRGTKGKLCVIFPKDYQNQGEFKAEALLYNSISASSNPGKFRSIELTGEIQNSETAGCALVARTPDNDSYKINFNALLADEFKTIVGGYKELRDVGTFSLRKEPY